MTESRQDDLRGRLLTTALYINEVLAYADAAEERIAMTDEMAALLMRAKTNLVATSSDYQLITDITSALNIYEGGKK